MILKQHLDIGGLEFDIAIRKPPPVDEAGTHELDGWMRAFVSMIREINEIGGEFAVWDQLSDEAYAIVEALADSASGGETNEGHAENARVQV